jgi:hypothetical protein
MWSRVPWTGASQILAILDGETTGARAPAVQDPKVYFDGLVASGALERAISFLSIALPPREAVQWAWRVLQFTAQPTDGEWRIRLRENIALWLAGPSEGLRRTIWSIAKERDESWPEKLLAGAIFFSGGSIGPEGGSVIEPPRAISGKLAASAIIAAAHASGSTAALLRLAAIDGSRIAEGEL